MKLPIILDWMKKESGFWKQNKKGRILSICAGEISSERAKES